MAPHSGCLTLVRGKCSVPLRGKTDVRVRGRARFLGFWICGFEWKAGDVSMMDAQIGRDFEMTA